MIEFNGFQGEKESKPEQLQYILLEKRPEGTNFGFIAALRRNKAEKSLNSDAKTLTTLVRKISEY